jgi:hypothetical protein
VRITRNLLIVASCDDDFFFLGRLLVRSFAKAGTPSEAPGPNAVTNATGYAMHDSRSADAVIRVYDDAGNVIETHQHKGDFKEW